MAKAKKPAKRASTRGKKTALPAPIANVGGRPTLLTPSTVARICASLKAGNYFEPSVVAAGVSKRIAYEWKAQGERDEAADIDSPQRRFLQAITEAEAQGEAELVETVRKHAKRNFRAAQALLEGRWRRRWAPELRVTLDKELDGMLDALKRGLSPEEYDRVLGLIAGEESGGAAEGDARAVPGGTGEGESPAAGSGGLGAPPDAEVPATASPEAPAGGAGGDSEG